MSVKPVFLVAALLLAVLPAHAEQTSAEGAGAAGKPRAPIEFSYEILGNPIVGQPIAINLQVTSSQSESISVEYRIIDASSMLFAESQALRVEVTPSAEDAPARQQVIVVPQREGRLYLNVAGSIETEAGTMIRAAAIPIQVGAAPRQQQVNGELKQSAEGETVISMPAEEN
jgi:hypothetical protein